ncbi:insulinase family protein [Pelagibacterium xiamenense]|uniref:insulinase family protein n=1 Tax=Pelagibacterium xiamenense TaxID=2901140 RepID=UPI001E57B077|nr:insulinase family protein [Pelagibacterium xiamenense]MCD7059474.1 insulinase family protein [Pelagibacterium xiamenense]
MSAADAFELIREEQIDEVNALARYYRHKKTGAELISLINDDENKVFGIAFATPPEDSTGIAHILEHSVLCGSEQFPVKKPFVEMLKGSLHTFLNAMTFPDKTVYPVASQNLADFRNLTEVYLDAVLFPLLSRETFEQEGWHYELENPDAPLIYKGVVFNEMKGGYSSPDQVQRTYAQNALFPDNTYGLSSGGDPKVMPELTYEQFAAFHKRYYHPSNAQIIFYGDDDPDARLEILEKYLSRFEKAERAPIVPVQPKFDAPRYEVRTYPADEENKRSAFVTLNWLIEETDDHTEALRRSVLAHALLGNSAAPLYKALTESGLGESVIGGLNGHYREPWFNAGLRNADAESADKIETLILDTLASLAEHGIDKATVESTVNTIEFSLREKNTGGYPRGIMYFFAALGDWLYGKDPLEALKYEDALATLKAELAAGKPVLEERIRSLLLDNSHRVTLVLKADKEQAEREEAAERAKLDAVRAGLSEEDVAGVIATTQKLKALQNAPDKPENLAKIPTLELKDLEREIKTVPTEELALSKVRTLYHDLPTNGIVYFDLGFDLKTLPRELIPYLPIFSRALTQTGTSKEDYVALSQRIGRSTGGIGAQRFASSLVDGEGSAAMLIVRGKAMADKTDDLLAIARDILTDAKLDNRDRIRQLVAQDKARHEAGLVPSGHMVAFSRLRASMTEADWLSEQCGGVLQLFFLRELAAKIEDDWESVSEALASIRDHLVNATTAVANVTADAESWTQFRPRLEAFLGDLPTRPAVLADWGSLPAPKNEGLTIPAQVNYVAKGVSLKKLGYEPSGALSVVTKYLGTTYLWDKIRVEGGAYGGFARFDPSAGIYAFGSYRDPNLTATLDVYDGVPDKLREDISDTDLTRSIIGTIGDLDGYQLPDAKGFTALVRTLTGATDAYRQARRDQVLATSKADFKEAADLIAEVARNGHVVALGSESAINKANAERNGFLEVTRVL